MRLTDMSCQWPISLSLSVNASLYAMHVKNHDQHSRARARACVRDMAASYAHLEIEPRGRAGPAEPISIASKHATRDGHGRLAGWPASHDIHDVKKSRPVRTTQREVFIGCEASWSVNEVL